MNHVDLLPELEARVTYCLARAKRQLGENKLEAALESLTDALSCYKDARDIRRKQKEAGGVVLFPDGE